MRVRRGGLGEEGRPPLFSQTSHSGQAPRRQLYPELPLSRGQRGAFPRGAAPAHRGVREMRPGDSTEARSALWSPGGEGWESEVPMGHPGPAWLPLRVRSSETRLGPLARVGAGLPHTPRPSAAGAWLRGERVSVSKGPGGALAPPSEPPGRGAPLCGSSWRHSHTQSGRWCTEIRSPSEQPGPGASAQRAH